MKLPGGLDMNAVRFAEDVRQVVLDLLPHARLVVVLPDEAERGSRFNNNETTLWRIESMFSEDDFLREPLKTIEAALVDAAKSDYWYTHEKDWGYPEIEDDSESEGC